MTLRKTFLGYKFVKKLLKRFTSQRDRERIYKYKFSKGSALRKRRRGVAVGRGDRVWKKCVSSLVKPREMLSPSWSVGI